MPDFDFDVLVIGSGPGGYVAAIRAAQLGLKTACVEKRETLGGTCLNVGCIPSKAWLHASEFYEDARNGTLAKMGVKIAGVELDLPAMAAEKDKAVKELTGGVAFLFKKNKVEWIKGAAAFADAHTVIVGERRVTAKNVIIATGSDVALLPGVEPDGETIITSTEALSLPSVPATLAIVGGGYIGLELGSVWRRLGAKVTVIEYAERITPAMDVEVSTEFAKILMKQGLDIRTSTKVVELKREEAGGATLTLEPAAGGDRTTLHADVVLLSIGRKPNTAGLNLAAAGLQVDDKGRVPVGTDFATAVPGIWAIGDVIVGPMLAHKAEDEGIACAETIAGMTSTVNHGVIPAVIYTHPEVASVGRTEEELKAEGVDYKSGKFPMMANSRSKTNRDTDGFVKVLADAKTDRVLGVHIISSMAGTMIAQAAQAMEFGASSEDIAYTCTAHPTHSEAIKEASMAVRGKAIHV